MFVKCVSFLDGFRPASTIITIFLCRRLSLSIKYNCKVLELSSLRLKVEVTTRLGTRKMLNNSFISFIFQTNKAGSSNDKTE